MWQRKQADLEAELQMTQQRLQALQKQKSGNERFVLSKEQQDEIVKFGMDANGRLKIFKNLASSSSTSSDTLTYSGTAKIGDSSTQDVSGFVTILIQPMGNNSYMGWITANRSILTDAPNENTATLSARLWLSTTELTDFSVKWKNSAGEVLGSDKTLTVTRDMVNGSTLITCEFYHKDAQNACFRAGKVMTDNADEY